MAWFDAQLKRLGKSQAALARHLGLPGPRITEIKQGKRRVISHEAAAIAQFLGVPVHEVLIRFGAQSNVRTYLEVSGTIDGTGRITMYDDRARDSASSERVASPFEGYTGIVVRVVGNAMADRYEDGDLVAYTPGNTAVDRLVGRDAVACLADGRTFLRRIQRGTQPDRYTLVAINRAEPPIVDAKLSWAAEIDWHRPHYPS